MIRTVLIRGETGEDIFSCKPFKGFTKPSADETIYIITDYFRANGTFKSELILTPATTTITSPDPSGSLIITDIVISADKTNNTTLLVQFTDGVNTAVIISPDTTNQAVNFSWAPQGRIQGWKNARIDVITGGVGTPSVAVTVGYLKIPSGLEFADWDALR